MEVVGEECEDDDDDDDSAGARAAGSEGEWADGGVEGGDCGWEGETRGRSGGTEKGSERAAFGREVRGVLRKGVVISP